MTARKVLAVDGKAVAGGARIPAARTWRMIGELLGRGYTKGQLAVWLGAKRPALQLNRERVTAETQAKVRRLYELLNQGRLRRG